MASVLLAAAALWVLWATPAVSQIATTTTEITPDRESWYWRDNAKVNPPGTGQQQEAFPVAGQQGHLQVALEDGEDDKWTFIGFDLSGAQDFQGSTVRSLRLTAEVSPPTAEHSQQHQEEADESQSVAVPPATNNADSAEFVACPVTGFMAGGADGDATTDADGERTDPTFDCDLATGSGSPSDDGSTWTFDLGRIAQLWAEGETIDTAVVLKPALDPPQPPDTGSSWTVEFHGRSQEGLSAQMTYTPAGAATDTEETFSPAEPRQTSTDADAEGTTTTPMSTGDTSPPAPSTTDAGTGSEGGDSESFAQQPARSVGPSPRFTWYAALPWPLMALALGFAYSALRGDGTAGAAQHRVASTLRGRREGADETREIPAPVGSPS